jgi:hypothetical protein
MPWWVRSKTPIFGYSAQGRNREWCRKRRGRDKAEIAQAINVKRVFDYIITFSAVCEA